MGGLIPLLLPAGSRSSAIYPSMEKERRASTISQTSPTLRKSHSWTNLKQARRLSQQAAQLPVLPSSALEWRRAVEEVKRKYMNRQYRACSARCCEILDNTKDAANIEHVHLIYLHFYAASSFEACARPLSNTAASYRASTSFRTQLLQDARKHYDMALSLTKASEDAAVAKTRSASRSSTNSSVRSPSLSFSDAQSIASTALSSRRNSSVYSVDELVPKPLVTPKTKKKVSFMLANLSDKEVDKVEKPATHAAPVWKPQNWESGPLIRPDSPTLGWEDDYHIFGRRESDAPSYVGMPPSPTRAPPPPPPESASELESEAESDEADLDDATPKPSATPFDVTEPFDLNAFLQNRTLTRLCTQLSALRAQMTWHRDSVDALLSEAANRASMDSIPAIPDIPPVLDLPAHLAKGPTLPVLSDSRPPSPSSILAAYEINSRPESVASVTSSSSGSLSGPSGSDEPMSARIERLRASGWQRKRFDTRRYAALREQVLGELRM